MSTTPTPALTPLQRLMADEPVFFKIIKFICVALLVAAALMEKFHVGTPFVIDLLTIGGSVGFGVASFVVKEANLLITQGLTVDNALKVIQDTTAEIETVKEAIKTPPPAPDLATAIKDAETALSDSAT